MPTAVTKALVSTSKLQLFQGDSVSAIQAGSEKDAPVVSKREGNSLFLKGLLH